MPIYNTFIEIIQTPKTYIIQENNLFTKHNKISYYKLVHYKHEHRIQKIIIFDQPNTNKIYPTKTP